MRVAVQWTGLRWGEVEWSGVEWSERDSSSSNTNWIVITTNDYNKHQLQDKWKLHYLTQLSSLLFNWKLEKQQQQQAPIIRSHLNSPHLTWKDKWWDHREGSKRRRMMEAVVHVEHGSVSHAQILLLLMRSRLWCVSSRVRVSEYPIDWCASLWEMAKINQLAEESNDLISFRRSQLDSSIVSSGKWTLPIGWLVGYQPDSLQRLLSIRVAIPYLGAYELCLMDIRQKTNRQSNGLLAWFHTPVAGSEARARQLDS